MKAFILATCLMTISAGSAFAISRHETTSLQCRQVQDLLQDEGAAILRWRSTRDPSLPIYGRYVSDGRFCNSGEVTEYATVPTANRRACPVRKCVVREPLERRGRILIPN